MKSKLAVSFSISAALFWLGAPAQAQDAAKVAAQVCASCHGQRGDSISPGFPKIGGQRADYLEAQLKAFRDRTRADPMAQAYMWGMTSQLGDDMIKSLAAFYSGQKPPQGRAGDPKLVQAGKAIYDGGLPQAKVPPCSTCPPVARPPERPPPKVSRLHLPLPPARPSGTAYCIGSG